jgi:indole-3-glycerol phosphate synthase
MPIAEVRARLRDAAPVRSFHDALARGFSVIAEHKRRSPSGGAMDPKNVALAYETYAKTPWVSAVSVLTDEDYFAGSLDDLSSARSKVGKPVLRKDFIVDEYQVEEARAFGADAILLMASVLVRDPPKMEALHALARSLDLDVLVEIGETERSIQELAELVPASARVVGVNARSFAAKNRDGGKADPSARHDLPTDVRRHAEFRRLVAPGKIAVAESGISTAAELWQARTAGYDAALVGTAFLSGPRDVASVVAELGSVFRDGDAPGG